MTLINTLITNIFANEFFNKLLILLTAFLLPIKVNMIAVGVLIILDTIIGTWASVKSGNKFTSKKLGNSISKMVLYQLLIISAHLCEVYITPIIPFISITLGFLAVTEFLSIGEGFSKITGLSFVQYIKKYLDEKFRDTKNPKSE